MPAKLDGSLLLALHDHRNTQMGLSIKTAVMVSVLAALWLLETWLPFYAEFREGRAPRLRHAARNLTMGLMNALLLALAFGALLAGAATLAERNQFGLLHQVAWPSWAEMLLGFVLFDLWMYVWHRANHRIPLLWRFHRMHHSDPEMDVTTGVRFHTGEVVLSAVARLAVLPLLGISIGQVAVYEAVFLPVVLFHHSNVRLPRWLDYGLLALIVTPAMHRVHHSRWQPETDSNYGSVFPYWDLLFRSFRLRNAGEIRLGLDGLDTPEWQTLAGMMRTPLQSPMERQRPER
jgi:sterol desaturase/sphingolipid hydroxylase (fatty acid hydroxylase superfamily)